MLVLSEFLLRLDEDWLRADDFCDGLPAADLFSSVYCSLLEAAEEEGGASCEDFGGDVAWSVVVEATEACVSVGAVAMVADVSVI